MLLEKEAEKWQSARFLFVRYFRLVMVLVFSYSINASKIISLCSTQCEKKRNRRRQRRLIGIIIIPGRLIESMPVVPVLFIFFVFNNSLLLLVSPYINLRLVYLLILFFFGFFSISWLRRHGFPWFVTGKVIHKTISRREIFTVDSQLSSALEVYVSCAQDFLFIPHIFLFSFVSIISCFSAAAPMRPWRLAGDGSARPDSKGKQQGNEEMKNGGGRADAKVAGLELQ